jgi:stage V sporulation protein AA
MQDTLYMNLPKSIQVTKPDVTIGDVAKFECTNQTILNKLKPVKLVTMPYNGQTRVVISALWIIQKVHEICPNVDVTAMGEANVVVKLASAKHKHPVWMWTKVVLVCLILFFGGAFAIMSFNNDVAVEKLFYDFYGQVTGSESDGFTPLEWAYSIGIFLGIMTFYNHFGKKNVSKDPTPIEVEVRQYENDITTTLTDGVNEEGAHLDVD